MTILISYTLYLYIEPLPIISSKNDMQENDLDFLYKNLTLRKRLIVL